MKINIIKSMCFIIILLILLKIFTYIVSPKNNGADDGVHYPDASGILAENENKIDVLILGNSEALTSIIPMEIWNKYGYTSYMCATVEQTIPEQIYLLRRALEKQNPKIIIIEADNLLIWSKISKFVSQEIEYEFPIAKYHNRWKNLNKNDFRKKIHYDKINHMKGYYYTNNIEKAENTDYMTKSVNISNIPRINKIYIKLLKEYLKINKIKLLIVKTPVTSTWNNNNHKVVKEFLDSNSIEFLDMNVLQNEINIDWEHDSKDGGEHLNYYGALKVTKYLGEYLKNLDILPDHRNDKNFQNWNESFEHYKKHVMKNN